jgi:hypothetical protein
MSMKRRVQSFSYLRWWSGGTPASKVARTRRAYSKQGDHIIPQRTQRPVLIYYLCSATMAVLLSIRHHTPPHPYLELVLLCILLYRLTNDNILGTMAMATPDTGCDEVV